MSTFTSKALLRKLHTKKKANGFTLIELMVIVAIAGVLSTVGAPQLLAAIDKAKDAAAEAVNAAKTCSLDLLTGSADYDADDFPLVTGNCAVSSDLVGTSKSSDGTTFIVSLDAAGIPSTPVSSADPADPAQDK